MSESTRVFLEWLATVLTLLAAIITGFVAGEWPTTPLPEPPPPVVEPVDDTRMVQGRFPFVGFGATALQACAPEDGGSWDVRIIPVGDDKNEAVASIPDDGDLVVLVYPEGGEHFITVNAWQRLNRRDCIFDAAHTAPATYYVQAEIVRGARISNYVMRGMGYIPRDVYPSNQYVLNCATDSHVDLTSFAFADDDLVRTTDVGTTGCETGDISMVRMVVGPTGGGRGGRGGGPNATLCGKQTWAINLGMENMRRNPSVGCVGRVNITSVVCFNVTDCGRYNAGLEANIRSVWSVGGPITGCAEDRALTYYDQNNPGPVEANVYLDNITSIAPSGCDWDRVTSLWDGDHTVFMRSSAQVPVSFDEAGLSEPLPDPEYPAPQLRLVDILDQTGANWGLTCTGEWEYRPNPLDERSYARVRAGDFAPSPWDGRAHYEQREGRLEVESGTPCLDSNGNRVPDWIEAGSPGQLMPDGRPLILHRLEGV